MILPFGPRTLPPVDGSILLPEAITFQERQNGNVPMYVFSEDGRADIIEITYRQFARACYNAPRVLNLFENALSKNLVVGIIALSDTAVYQATLVGLMCAGFIPFPISPRNTAEAIVNLLRKTDCHRILTTYASLKVIVDKTKEELERTEPGYKLTVTEMPILPQLFPELCSSSGLESAPTDIGEFTKPDSDSIAMYLHSSGSTGLPKAIPKTHREIVEFVTFPATIHLRDRRNPLTRIAAMHLPPFHALGLHCHVFLPLLACITVAIYPPRVIRPDLVPTMPTPDNILDLAQKTACSVIITIPSLLQIWAQNPKYMNILISMSEVKFSGGALSRKIGKFLREKGVRLTTSYGGTEFGAPCSSSYREGDEDDWEYVEFTHKSNIRWVSQENGLYECQFLICPTHHISVINLPDVQGYATSDLFIRHQTKDYLWKIVGRVDDVIIHSSGEKTVPPPMENVLYSSPYLMGVVMFGHAHSQPGVLVEPTSASHVDVHNKEEVERFRNLIWPIVEEANRIAPAFSRIFKELILVADPSKPFIRAGKGTVIRKATLNLYAEEIEALYSTLEESIVADDKVAPLRRWDEQDIKQWIFDQALALSSDRVTSTSISLFEQGFDSLSATILRRRITRALLIAMPDTSKSVLHAIDQNIVYAFPTIDSLSKRLVDLSNNPALADDHDHVEAIERMITNHRFNHVLTNSGNESNEVVVLLTGSTGHLGSHVLANLLRDPQISFVYTLNRPHKNGSSTQARQFQRFIEEGLDVNLLSLGKLAKLEGNCEEERLGLPEDILTELRARITAIIHSSWKLDFNQPLASFEPNIRQTHNLIDLARSSSCGSRVKFIFTSSVSVAQGWKCDNGPYPEEIVPNATYAVGMGYGESKYVTERILQTSGINTISLRISQITGSPVNGSWSTSDWVPIMIKSSIHLGALPSVIGRVSWIPVAVVANAIHTVLFSSDHYPAALNVIHPTGTPWDAVMRYVSDTFLKERQLSIPLLPFQDWFTHLHKKSDLPQREDAVNIPAIRLYDFFKRMANTDADERNSLRGSSAKSTSFSVGKVEPIGKMLHDLSDLTGKEVELWIKYWIRIGYFD
ncbi:putative aminoadipate reductase [Pholiota conissans]|uniref:Aminoadipate reductase n=1 Tax=Pholiota conissans TaxID=109636 RepID=A0A9P5ZAV2_9AGAR|nr:putative aminoadipate reductase [Pholiota conissans]